MEASRKLEDGKFCKLRYEDGAITILGDFFVHPESAIEDLEAVIESAIGNRNGAPTAADVERAIRDHLTADDVTLVGLTPGVLAELAVEVAE